MSTALSNKPSSIISHIAFPNANEPIPIEFSTALPTELDTPKNIALPPELSPCTASAVLLVVPCTALRAYPTPIITASVAAAGLSNLN